MGVTLLIYLSAAIIGVLSTARISSLIVEDKWPPSMWLRDKWATLMKDGPWAKLITCLWCVPPWIVAPNLAFALLSDLHPVWWVLNGWMAASLVTSWVAIKVRE